MTAQESIKKKKKKKKKKKQSISIILSNIIPRKANLYWSGSSERER